MTDKLEEWNKYDENTDNILQISKIIKKLNISKLDDEYIDFLSIISMCYNIIDNFDMVFKTKNNLTDYLILPFKIKEVEERIKSKEIEAILNFNNSNIIEKTYEDFDYLKLLNIQFDKCNLSSLDIDDLKKSYRKYNIPYIENLFWFIINNGFINASKYDIYYLYNFNPKQIYKYKRKINLYFDSYMASLLYLISPFKNIKLGECIINLIKYFD